jgi:hypothetical protein
MTRSVATVKTKARLFRGADATADRNEMEHHGAQSTTQLRNARMTKAAFGNGRYERQPADHGQSKISTVSVQWIVSIKPMLN